MVPGRGSRAPICEAGLCPRRVTDSRTAEKLPIDEDLEAAQREPWAFVFVERPSQEARFLMKSSLSAARLVVLLSVASCGVNVVGGDNDDGDSGGSGGSGNGGNGASSNGGNGASANGGSTTSLTPTSASGASGGMGTGGFPASCSDIGCDGTSDPTTNCVACSQDVGGECEAEATACDEACGTIFDCLEACPDDNPATANVNELWQCICSSNTVGECSAPMAGSCFEDPAAAQQFLDLNDCFLATCTDPTCT